jgi:phosphogluconate dehydratase
MPEHLIQSNGIGMGRDLFAASRRNALTAEEGACSWL